MSTLTRAEAHELIDAAEQAGELAKLAAHWELAGHWNETAEWTSDCLHEHVDYCAATRTSGPRESDDTGLTACEF